MRTIAVMPASILGECVWPLRGPTRAGRGVFYPAGDWSIDAPTDSVAVGLYPPMLRKSA